MDATQRSKEQLDANLNVNKARELKHGTPGLISHGGTTVNMSTTLKSEHPPVASEAPKNIGPRKQMKLQQARRKAMAEMEDREMKATQRLEDDVPKQEPIKLVSSREHLAATLQPKGERDYDKDEPSSFWSSRAGQMPGMTAASQGGAFRRQNVITKEDNDGA